MALSNVKMASLLPLIFAAGLCSGCSRGIPRPAVLAYVEIGPRPLTDRLIVLGGRDHATAWVAKRAPRTVRGISISGGKILLQSESFRPGKSRKWLGIGNAESEPGAVKSLNLDDQWDGVPFLFNSGKNILYIRKSSGSDTALLRNFTLADEKSTTSVEIPLSEGIKRPWYKIVSVSSGGRLALLLEYSFTPSGAQTSLLQVDLLRAVATEVGNVSDGISAATYISSASTQDDIVALTRQGIEVFTPGSTLHWTFVGTRPQGLHFRGNRIVSCPGRREVFMPFFDSATRRSELWSFDTQTNVWSRLQSVRDGKIDYVSCM